MKTKVIIGDVTSTLSRYLCSKNRVTIVCCFSSPQSKMFVFSHDTFIISGYPPQSAEQSETMSELMKGFELDRKFYIVIKVKTEILKRYWSGSPTEKSRTLGLVLTVMETNICSHLQIESISPDDRNYVKICFSILLVSTANIWAQIIQTTGTRSCWSCGPWWCWWSPSDGVSSLSVGWETISLLE